MGVFSTESSTSPLEVTCPPMQVYVAHATGHAGSRATFGTWALESRLKVLGIFYGSSVAGASYARLEGVTGQPAGAQVDVEGSDMLYPGDRVCIGFLEGETFRAVFSGYFLQGQIDIDISSERVVYRIAGPEWAWGSEGRNSGADKVVVGQWRRTAAADATWWATEATVTPRADLFQNIAIPCVFNPKGRINRSLNTVSTDEASGVGYIFEEPDRVRTNGPTSTAKSSEWTRKTAIHHLLAFFNDPAFTGIDNPALAGVDPTVAGNGLRDVNVNGSTLWEALQKVCGPGIRFAVSPIPSSGYWGGFAFTAFPASSGASADLVLSTRGTDMSAAVASVSRVSAVKDIGKTVNHVTVMGEAYRHVRLRYKEGDPEAEPADPTEAEKPYLLQPGWIDDEGKTPDYADGAKLDETTIDSKGTTLAQRWRTRYTTGGAEFPRYANVFRRFVWNESGEFSGPLGGENVGYSSSYERPDLTGIADAAGFPQPDGYVNGYTRRRRPLLDTAYVMKGSGDRVRIKPIVWLTTWKSGTPATKYVIRLPESKYKIDREVAGLWITVPDIARWRPFAPDTDALEGETLPTLPMAEETFATMLHDSRLWLTVEASIEVDVPLIGHAPRATTSGSPHLREAVIDAGQSLIMTLEMDQSALGSDWTSFAAFTPTTIDDSAKATEIAEQSREAGEDEQVHASIICEPDWPIQAIGKMADQITGRGINLATKTGRGAQIVAISFDPNSGTIEHLTESAAMEVVQAEKTRIANRKVVTKGGLPK